MFQRLLVLTLLQSSASQSIGKKRVSRNEKRTSLLPSRLADDRHNRFDSFPSCLLFLVCILIFKHDRGHIQCLFHSCVSMPKQTSSHVAL